MVIFQKMCSSKYKHLIRVHWILTIFCWNLSDVTFRFPENLALFGILCVTVVILFSWLIGHFYDRWAPLKIFSLQRLSTDCWSQMNNFVQVSSGILHFTNWAKIGRVSALFLFWRVPVSFALCALLTCMSIWLKE